MCGCFFFFFKQKTAYEITVWLEFRRVLFRSACGMSCGHQPFLYNDCKLSARGLKALPINWWISVAFAMKISYLDGISSVKWFPDRKRPTQKVLPLDPISQLGCWFCDIALQHPSLLKKKYKGLKVCKPAAHHANNWFDLIQRSCFNVWHWVWFCSQYNSTCSV